MKLSIVIPVYNEEQSLPELLLQIETVCQMNHYQKEVIFVDDGSSDSSWTVIKNLAATHEDVRAIRFRRNFGKAAALEAGFQSAEGDFVFTMDADLQDDPAEIPHFLAKMEEGFDLVSGWKQNRHDPTLGKVLPSRIFNAMVSTLTGVHLHDHNCGFKCLRRDVIQEVHIYGEQHRFIPVLAAARGFRVGEIVVNHRKRQFGRSKYGFARFIKGFFDLLSVSLTTKYSQRPLHVLGTLGLVLMLVGFLMAYLPGWIYTGCVIYGSSLTPSVSAGSSTGGSPGWLLLNYLLFNGCVAIGQIVLLLGGMFLVAGVAAELLANFHQHPQASNYAISERLTTMDTPPQNAVLPPLRLEPDALELDTQKPAATPTEGFSQAEPLQKPEGPLDSTNLR